MANDSLDFVQRGKVSIVRRQYAEAVKICRLGLLAHPTLLEGRLVLGMALTALGRWDEVLAEMRVALEVDPINALAWLLKGEALVGKGDYAQAEGTLKRAKELDPSNTKADQLLAEISVARAAGFEGIPAEPTDTKVYPAKVSDGADPKVKEAAQRLTAGDVADLPEGTGEHEVEYDDEATDVDPDPSDRIRLHEQMAKAAALANAVRPSAGAAPLPKLSVAAPDDEKEDSSTDLFLPPRGGMEASYEPPAADDYAERARPPVMSHAAGGSSLSEEPSIPGTETRTPIELHRPHRAARRAVDAIPNTTPPLGSRSQFDSSEPSIELSGVDLLAVETTGSRFDVSDEEQEDTHERKKRQVDPEAGTRPETPDPVVHRARPLRPFEPSPEAAGIPVPRPGAKKEARMPTWGDNVVETGHRAAPAGLGKADETGGAPGVVRVPLSPTTKRPTVEAPSFVGRVRYALFGDRHGSGLALFGAALIAVIAAGVLSGLFVREYRMRQRVTRRHEMAKQKLQSGNYPGFQAAELLYRQILQERDDPEARALRARTLAQMSFEFGDPTDAAQRAVQGLGDADTSTEAQEARVYLAMARGELDRAGRLATALRRTSTDAASSYLVGRAELLLERPESAADALRGAADKLPRDPLVQHALGLAEEAAGHEDRAQEAYRRALDANANHIATLIDRAVLQIHHASPEAGATRTPADLEPVRATLEGVVYKLAGDSSPGQLARAFLALGELELARGDVDAARKALASALAKRREGDFLLSEELAQSLARAFELDQAEKEAKRAVAGFGGSGRLAPRLTLAQVALKRGRPSQALQIIEEAGTSKPEALVLRSEAQLALGRRDGARNDAEAALRVQPDLIPAKVALARVDIADGHPERAQRELDRIERAVKLPGVAETLGEVFGAYHFNDRARYWYVEALKRDPLDIDAQLRLSRLDREAGKLDDARKGLEKLLLLNPQYVPARREQAQLLLESGDAQSAREQFDRLADQADDAETLMGAARAHLYAGDGTGAEERLKRASARGLAGPMAEEVADLTARAYLLQHRPDDAIALLKKIAPTAQRAETGALLMQAYLDLDQQDNAAKVPLVLPPRLRLTPEMQTERARLQVERGRDVLAEEVSLSALVRMQPPQPKSAPPRPPNAKAIARRWVIAEALVALGRSQYDQGMFRSSLRALKQATELDPTNARAFYHYAFVLEEVHKVGEAREAMEQAVKIDPRYPDALYNLGRMRADANDPKAREAYQKYLEVAPKGIYAADARRSLESGPTPTSSRLRKRRRGR